MAIRSENTLQWAISVNGIWHWRNTAVEITQKKWVHIALSFDSSTVKSYMNKELVESFAYTGKTDQTAEPARISGRYGRYNQVSDGSSFNGIIDEVRIYNRALSDSEIQLLYQVEKSGLVNQLSQTPRSCNHALALGIKRENGIYKIDPDGEGGIQAFEAYCDMTTDGVGGF